MRERGVRRQLVPLLQCGGGQDVRGLAGSGAVALERRGAPERRHAQQRVQCRAMTGKRGNQPVDVLCARLCTERQSGGAGNRKRASERTRTEKGRVSKAVFVTLRDGTREGSRRRACPTYLGRFPTPSALGRLPLRVPGVHESLPEEAVVQQRWQARHRPRERRGCWRGAATCAVTRANRRERLSASGAARGGNVPVRALEARPVRANKHSRARGQL